MIAMQPEIIILDEPTTGQDRRGCAQIMDIAKEFQRRGHTVIVVTHAMSLVAEYADRVIVMCKGRRILDGPTAEVFAQEEKLKESFVLPPQVTRLARAMSAALPVDHTILSTQELSGCIAARVQAN